MDLLLEWIGKKGLLTIFFFVGLEYSCFPLPSEFILPFIGSIASVCGYNIIGVILFSVVVSYFGCLICYLIGYYGGAYLYNKIYNKSKKWRRGLDLASNKFQKYGNISVFVCRLVPLCRTYISFFAGMFKQSLFAYSFYSIIGIFIWNTVLIISGYTLTSNWHVIGGYYDKYKFILIFIIFIIFMLFVLKMHKKGKIDKTINGD